MNRNLIKITGIILILLAIILIFIMNKLINPVGETDTAPYLLEKGINAIRYITLAYFSFILGIKLLFKD